MRYEGSFAGRRVSRIVDGKQAFGYSRQFMKGKKSQHLKGVETEPEDVMENLGINRMDGKE
jgi:hypothetical protein